MKIKSVIAAACLLGGCATGAGPGILGSDGPDANGTTDLLPYIDIGDVDRLEKSSANDFYDRYTRIFAVIDECHLYSKNNVHCQAAGGRDTVRRDYDSEDRNWVRRWLIGKTVAEAFLISFNINETEFQITKELFSLSWDSNNTQGEVWSTTQTVDMIISPYFKVDANTRLNMAVQLNLSENNKSEISANVVAALSKAAALIAPSAGLLTDLSSERVTEASKFLDDNVSALFDKSITEKLDKDVPIERYEVSPAYDPSASALCGLIATVYLDLPHVHDIKDVGGRRDGVGRWDIYLERPRSSIFVKQDKIEGCDNRDSATDRLTVPTPNFSSLQLGDVLDFKIATDLTIYDYAFSRLELTDLIKVLNEKAVSEDDDQQSEAVEAARTICVRVERKLSDLGLNTYDTAAALWAIARSDQFKAKAGDLILKTQNCGAAHRWRTHERDKLPEGAIPT